MDELRQEITSLRLQKPRMKIEDIMDDEEKVNILFKHTEDANNPRHVLYLMHTTCSIFCCTYSCLLVPDWRAV